MPKRANGLVSVSAIAGLAFASLSPGPAGAVTEQQQDSASMSLVAPSNDSCARLATFKSRNVEISLAVSQAAGVRVANAGLTSMYGKSAVVASQLPGFCRVVGHIRPEKGSDIGFELWLPSTGWDGRLHGIGIGGFAGGIDYFNLGIAIKSGQAGLATDTGHSGTMIDSDWARGHPGLVRDYGWRAIHLSTVAAKKVLAAFYGKGPDKSYFVGCSGGGRQGLMEVARYPDDYDGVVAGAPAANWTDLAMAITNAVQAQAAPDAFIRRDQTRFLQEEVIRQCDGKDGQIDGLIADARQCRFDASKLACGTSKATQCFSTPQIAALDRIHRGAFDSQGRRVAYGYLPSGSEVGNPSPILGWEGYIFHTKTERSGGDTLASGLFEHFVQKPFTTTATFDFTKDPARLKKILSSDLDAPLNLSRYFARGGKLIVWHGWADAAIPPEATLQYYDAVKAQSGKGAADSLRLFMVPNVQHCSGGNGPDAFGQAGAPKPGETPDRNMVAALQSWVEGKRAAPETLVARRGHGVPATAEAPERQRLLCAWPKKAVLQSGGDADRAASYSCS